MEDKECSLRKLLEQIDTAKDGLESACWAARNALEEANHVETDAQDEFTQLIELGIVPGSKWAKLGSDGLFTVKTYDYSLSRGATVIFTDGKKEFKGSGIGVIKRAIESGEIKKQEG